MDSLRQNPDLTVMIFELSDLTLAKWSLHAEKIEKRKKKVRTTELQSYADPPPWVK